jgi:UDP-N-acetylmuramate: L-alanyl-gamma-D-glutamyl-meso-diaminopimelate ligase
MKVHLIGICGTGMGTLAGLLKAAGHDVRGSDEHVYPPMSTQLAEQKIPVFETFGAANLDWGPDAVVVGNVCRKDQVEVLAAQARQIPLESFPSLFGKLFLERVDVAGLGPAESVAGGHGDPPRVPVLKPRKSIVIAGTHGKTTTSSLLAQVLADAGRDPSFLIGGVPLNFRQSWRLGAGEEFVVEGDEYDTAFFDKGSKFLHYRPQIALLTSVEFDHADIFRDEEAVQAAFRKFVALLPEDGLLVACAASPGAMEVARSARCQVVTYGRPGSGADWTFEVVARALGGRATLAVARRGERVVTVDTNLPGIYNYENLVGVIAVASALGVELPAIARAVRRFLGVRRRQEVRGVARGVTVVDDFAHHPTAIRETILALKGRFGPGKLIAAFEPRSATSRRNVFQTEFADALSVADEVVLAPLYAPEKVPEADRLDVERLAADLRREDVPARLIPTVEATVAHLAERASPGDTVLVMSSGDYGGLHDRLLNALGDPVMPARAEHKARIGNLLDRVGIAHPVLEQFWPSYLVIPGAEPDAPLVGCVAIEVAGEVALLRMLAVAPERRGEGLGYVLVEAATERARALGVGRLYLVTDGAQGYFGERLGFVAVDRKDVTAAIAATAEYALARSKNATWMRKEL